MHGRGYVLLVYYYWFRHISSPMQARQHWPANQPMTRRRDDGAFTPGPEQSSRPGVWHSRINLPFRPACLRRACPYACARRRCVWLPVHATAAPCPYACAASFVSLCSRSPRFDAPSDSNAPPRVASNEQPRTRQCAGGWHPIIAYFGGLASS